MQETNRFFLWVNRLLALGALLGLLLLAVFALWGFGSSFVLPYSPDVVVPAAKTGAPPVRAKLRVANVISLTGTTSRMIELRAAEPAGGSSLGLKEPSYGAIRNLLFLGGDPAEPRWLFDDAEKLLIRVEPVCMDRVPHYRDACAQAQKRTLAVYLEVVAADTNRDGIMDRQDGIVPALVHTDGSGYTPLGDSVDNVVDVTVSPDGTRLNLLVEKAGALHDHGYSLADFRPLSSRKIADLAR